MEFVHLQLKSSYSLLKSTCDIEAVVKKAKEQGYRALAITDEDVMYGAIPFYKACHKHGIKPIIGLSASILGEDGAHPLVLLAKNQQGYQHLLKISSAIQTRSPEGLPKKWLRSYAEGLIAITPGTQGEIEQLFLDNNEEKAEEAIAFYQEIFADFYFGLQNHFLLEESTLKGKLTQWSEAYNIPLVATNDVYYIEKEDAIVQECLLSIDAGTKMEDEQRPRMNAEEYYLKDKEEMKQLFPEDEAALHMAGMIAERCEVKIDFDKRIVPKYPTEGSDAATLLEELCMEGLHQRYSQVGEEHMERLSYELTIIKNMNFCDYFLIVWDFMKYARENHILTGPGRGSAAGSLVAYVLHITNVDPLQYGLLFERFLNPERVTMPDIDIDFPDQKRDQIIQYVAQKYGSLHVAQIVTFGTLAAKASIRDVSRVMGLPPKEIDGFSKQIPSKLGITLKEAYEISVNFRHYVHASVKNERIYEIARKIEGLPRHTSVHAAGVVMSDKSLTEYVPLQEGHEGVFITQYSGDILEELGLLKMDFLGLRNLTIIEKICAAIEKRTKKKINVDDIPLDDEETFALLGSGDTTGVFQLESSGIRKVLQQLQPTQFEDIVAVNALYRPGPMEQIPTFIDSKHGKKQPVYIHPDLKPILERTYGVMIYQEQIMEIATKMAGFSLGESDLLRRAMSKKKKEVLDAERIHFVAGCVKNGYSEKVANDIYDLIARFANYGFNRSHAVAYSMIAYQLAYLKTHYPLEFLSCLLTNYIGNDKKIAMTIAEMGKRKLVLLPPSINKSQFAFAVEGESIRYGLLALKSVGTPIVKEIIHGRKKGPYKDLFDFCMRVPVTQPILTKLIMAGCLDDFGLDRNILLENIEVAMEYVELVRPDGDDQMDFFMEEQLIPRPSYKETAGEMSQMDKLNGEKEVLGFYLSGHPTLPYQSLKETMKTTSLLTASGHMKGIVYVSRIKTIRTKKGQEMAFLTISDETVEMDSTMFPNEYNQYMPILKKGHIYYLEGTIEDRNGKRQMIIKQVKPIQQIEEYAAYLNQSLYLKLDEHHEAFQDEMKRVLLKYSGFVPVYVYYEQTKKLMKLPNSYQVHPNDNCLFELKKLLGEKNVILR